MFFYIFVLLCFFFFSSTQAIPISGEINGCGISPALNRYRDITGDNNKIMGGVISPPHFWPWIAALMSPKEGKNPSQYCTGEIIGDRWIITAEHCKEEVEEGFFIVGTNNVKRINNQTKYEIKTHYLPPDNTSDIILVELSRNLEFSKNVSPICISKSFEPTVGDIAIVAGFGLLFTEYDEDSDTRVDGIRTNLLHEGMVTIKNVTECEKMDDEMQGYICAGGINRGVMPGDSGGPIMGIKDDKFYLFGDVSGGRAYREGDDNLTVDELDAYTIVSSHCNWIEEVTNGGVKCEE